MAPRGIKKHHGPVWGSEQKEEFSPAKENKEKLVVSFTYSLHCFFFCFFEEKKKSCITKNAEKNPSR
jgi:hypothetical protein